MKLQLFCIIVTFMSFFILIKSDLQHHPSFLRLIGSYKYNNANNGKITLKHYYLSQRIAHKWVKAFIACKSVGMRLAFIETDDELHNLAALGRNSKLFHRKVFVDGYNLTITDDNYHSERHDGKLCYSIRKEPIGKLETSSEMCNGDSHKFLCEDVEVADTYEATDQSDTFVDVKSTFFTYAGNFEKKKYFASFNFKAPPNEVPMICQSFGMQMVSPINQAEFDNLRNLLLQQFNGVSDYVAIAGYRSDKNPRDWIVYNNKIEYEMNWNDGEPNNYRDSENCLGLHFAYQNTSLPKLNDIHCGAEAAFFCEYNDSLDNDNDNTYNQADRSMMLKPVTKFKIGTLEKEYFVSRYEVDWITANLICKSLELELLAPSSETEGDILRKHLDKSGDTPTNLHLGVTSTGTDNIWYAIASGKIINFDFKWSRSQIPVDNYYSSYYPSKENCLRLNKESGKFLYDVGTCIDSLSNFLCQKVNEQANRAR